MNNNTAISVIKIFNKKTGELTPANNPGKGIKIGKSDYIFPNEEILQHIREIKRYTV